MGGGEKNTWKGLLKVEGKEAKIGVECWNGVSRESWKWSMTKKTKKVISFFDERKNFFYSPPNYVIMFMFGPVTYRTGCNQPCGRHCSLVSYSELKRVCKITEAFSIE
jgi:hypothetical protein